jgi:VanZ family protein
MLSILSYWLPVVIYAGFIFTLSSVPGKNIPGLFPYQDVVFHFLEYAVFALLITRAMKGSYPRMARVKRLLLVVAFALGYALLDEFHQSFVPGRTASLADAAIDTAGSFLAACFL